MRESGKLSLRPCCPELPRLQQAVLVDRASVELCWQLSHRDESYPAPRLHVAESRRQNAADAVWIDHLQRCTVRPRIWGQAYCVVGIHVDCSVYWRDFRRVDRNHNSFAWTRCGKLPLTASSAVLKPWRCPVSRRATGNLLFHVGVWSGTHVAAGGTVRGDLARSAALEDGATLPKSNGHDGGEQQQISLQRRVCHALLLYVLTWCAVCCISSALPQRPLSTISVALVWLCMFCRRE